MCYFFGPFARTYITCRWPIEFCECKGLKGRQKISTPFTRLRRVALNALPVVIICLGLVIGKARGLGAIESYIRSNIGELRVFFRGQWMLDPTLMHVFDMGITVANISDVQYEHHDRL